MEIYLKVYKFYIIVIIGCVSILHTYFLELKQIIYEMLYKRGISTLPMLGRGEVMGQSEIVLVGLFRLATRKGSREVGYRKLEWLASLSPRVSS